MVEHITHNPKSEGLNPVSRTGGLYYKNMTIVNDDTCWSVTLESSILILKSSITRLESSIILIDVNYALKNICSTGSTHGDHMMIIIRF